MCSTQHLSPLLRLRVIADADVGIICRVLERFRTLNVVPLRLAAEVSVNEMLHLEVDVFNVTEPQMQLIAAKVQEAVSVISAHWHQL